MIQRSSMHLGNLLSSTSKMKVRHFLGRAEPVCSTERRRTPLIRRIRGHQVLRMPITR